MLLFKIDDLKTVGALQKGKLLTKFSNTGNFVNSFNGNINLLSEILCIFELMKLYFGFLFRYSIKTSSLSFFEISSESCLPKILYQLKIVLYLKNKLYPYFFIV